MNTSKIIIEKQIGKMFKKEYSIFMRNGTTALWVLLKALDIKRGKIIVPVNICYVVPLAIFLSGNEPYFVDIDDSYTIDPQELEGIDSDQIKAVIMPYMYGNTGHIEEIKKICKDKNWILIEDVAQSLGAKIGTHYVGSFSEYSMTSFGMGKIIDVNFGGVLCFNSKPLYKETIKIYESLPPLSKKMLSFSMHFSQFYFLMVDFIEKGDDLSRFGIPLADTYKDCFLSNIGNDTSFFPILDNKLNFLQDELVIRNANAELFQKIIKHENVVPLKHNEGATYWRQNILAKKDREGLLKYLKENKIKASKYFPSIDRFFYVRKDGMFKRSDQMFRQLINLWPGKETTEGDIIKINGLIHDYYGKMAEK